MLVHEYETFKMEEGERVEQIFERLYVIVNDLHVLGKIISKRELNMKILKNLPRLLQSKVDVI